MLEDVGVPLSALADLVASIEKMAADTGLMISVIAHAGDGNTHPLIVYDPTDAEMTERAEKAFGDIMDLAISLGGTITGEHGVGRLKKPWLADYRGPEAWNSTAASRSPWIPTHPQPGRCHLRFAGASVARTRTSLPRGL